MASSTSFPPQADGALLAARLNFSTLISATPTAFGLSAAQATSFASLYQAFATAMQGVDPGVRGKASVLAVDDGGTWPGVTVLVLPFR